MKNHLPKHILDALRNNKTSLGEHPSFPPEEEETFIIKEMEKTFNKLSENVEIEDYATLKHKLSAILSECKKAESNNRQALEELCGKIVNDIFNIPKDSITIDAKIVDNIKTSDERLVPEATVDFSFDSIEDMNYLTDEIYKRRILNALVEGASMYYTFAYKEYIKEIFDINIELPSLYKKALDYNNLLMFYEKDTFNEKGTTNGGKVDVTISSNDAYPIIKSEGLLFPILLGETIKGILELAISHGLPDKREKAKYVLSKSDFKLAEMWDMRLGYCLWSIIEEGIENAGYDILEVGINFFLMEIAQLDCEEFNKTLQEIFGRTVRGKELIAKICDNILYSKEKDDFDDYIRTKNDDLVQINDNEYFTSEELLSDSYDALEQTF